MRQSLRVGSYLMRQKLTGKKKFPLLVELDRHPLLEDGVRLLDLAAARALQVACEQRLELHEQRELRVASQLLAQDVGPDAQGLAQWHGH
jgi:hypothetical protein